jgi:CheY-like chemotaxis protein
VDVYLPSDRPSAADRAEDSVPRSVKGTILVVDDEPSVASVTGRLLSMRGYEVVTVSSGAEAMEALSSRLEEIDVVLLDVTMPVMTGDEALRELRHIRADVPIVLCSGLDRQTALQRFGEHEPDGFLQKPFDYGQVCVVLEGLLGR